MMAALPPVKRTALYRKHLALGAAMTDFHGWQVAARFAAPEDEASCAEEMVGLADVGWMGKLEVQGLVAEVSGVGTGSRSLWPLARGHWLVMYPPEERDAATQEIEALASGHPCARLTDVTSVHAAFHLWGPRSRDVLCRLTSLDLSDGSLPDRGCAQAGLAQVRAIFLRRDADDLPCFRLLVAREYGEFVWDALMHAGRELGIVPLGLDALLKLEPGARG
jgi:heterotetrameric sarcosine oxidase gamma subunit